LYIYAILCSLQQDCGKKYSGKDDKKSLDKETINEVIALRRIYEGLTNQDSPPSPSQRFPVTITGGRMVRLGRETLTAMTLDRFTQIAPAAIQNLVEKRAESWKPLLGECRKCREWCWECQLRCRCGEATEPVNVNEKTLKDCGGMDEGPPEENVISGNDGSHEYPAPPLPLRCLVHNGLPFPALSPSHILTCSPPEAVTNPSTLNEHFCWSCGLWPLAYKEPSWEGRSGPPGTMDSSDEREGWSSYR
jgi:hypothetical protein